MMHMHSTNYLTGQIYFLTCRSRDLDDPAHHAHCEARGLNPQLYHDMICCLEEVQKVKEQINSSYSQET